MILFHHPESAAYSVEGHPEAPFRVELSRAALAASHPDWEWRLAPEADASALLLAHDKRHLEAVESAPEWFDGDTPNYPGIALHARRSAGAAVSAAELALSGAGPVFSLMRPPGHHATRNRAMGFCYFNSVAVATLRAAGEGGGPRRRVAVWDFDAHHGNGTEEILHGHPRVRFASVHQYPGYPGTGREHRGNCLNWPVPPGIDPETQMAKLRESLGALLDFKPDLLIVSAGFDAYGPDPITHLNLRAEDFARLGTWLRETGLPAAAVMEGGYSADLPALIDAFLTSWNAPEKAGGG